MDNLSIIINNLTDESCLKLEVLKPLTEMFKTQVILINNEYRNLDISYRFIEFEFNEEQSNFLNYCFSLSKYDKVLILENGVQLDNNVVDLLTSELLQLNGNLLVNIKKYLDKNKENFILQEQILVHNKNLKDSYVSSILLEDFSLTYIENNLEKILFDLIISNKFHSIFLWYKNTVLNSSSKNINRFYENLEKLKLKLNDEAVEKLENLFIENSLDKKYSAYLTIKRLFKEKKVNYISSVKNILSNISYDSEQMYFGYLIIHIIRDTNDVMNLFTNIEAKMQFKYLDFLFKEVDEFYKRIYNFIASIDLFSEANVKNNTKIIIYVNIIKAYIKNMKFQSETIDKKEKLIQLFVDYTNYGFYLIDKKNFNIGERYLSNNEIKFLEQINKAINNLNNKKLKEAINMLESATYFYDDMNMPVRYYIQKMCNENRFYDCKLSICMIVKNEEKNIERCLSSLKPLIDNKVAELIIVDTGSNDKTVEISQKYTSNIYFKLWNGNFSEARNYSLTFAKGEYIFIMDADNEMESGEVQKLIDIFVGKDYINYNTYTFKIKNFIDEKLDNSTLMTQPLIFRNDCTFYYTGKIHNQPVFKKQVNHLNITILHYGYIMTEDIKNKKFIRTSTILKKELEKTPKSLYYRFQLGVSYSMHGDQELALEQVETYINNIKNGWYGDKYKLNLMYYSIAALIYTNSGLYKKVHEVCDIGIKMEPEYIDFIYYKALAFYQQEKYKQCIEWTNKYLNLLKNFDVHPLLNDDRYVFYYLDYKNQAYIMKLFSLYKLKLYTDCIKFALNFNNNKVIKDTLFVIITAYFKAKNYNNMLTYYERCIMKNNDAIKSIWEYFVEEKLNEISDKEREKWIKTFAASEINDDYINKIRFRIGNKIKQDPQKILAFINKYDISSVDKNDLVTTEMIFNTTYSIVKEYIVDIDKDETEIKTLKKVIFFILERALNFKQLTSLSDEELLYLTKKYINICLMFQDSCMKNILNEKEKRFTYYVKKALEVEKTDILNCVRFIKNSVEELNEMARPMELYLKEILENAKFKTSNIEGKNINAKDKMNEYAVEIKKEIEILINKGDLDEALNLIEEYEKLIDNDIEMYSIKSVVLIRQNEIHKAKKVLKQGLVLDNNNFDILYNLAYVCEILKEYDECITFYKKALNNCSNTEIKESIEKNLKNINKILHNE